MRVTKAFIVMSTYHLSSAPDEIGVNKLRFAHKIEEISKISEKGSG
jgi:hypothetical protein